MLPRYVLYFPDLSHADFFLFLQVLRALTVSLNTITAKQEMQNKDEEQAEPRTLSNAGSNKKNSITFDEDSWGSSVKRFWDSAGKLNEDKWELIYMASESYICDIPKAGAGPALKDALNKVVGRSERMTMTTGSNDDDIVVSD